MVGSTNMVTSPFFKILILLLFVSLSAFAEEDIRYCGAIKYASDGTIYRSTSKVNSFKKLHPCLSTGLNYGSCPGWNIDHVIPLACGGCDEVFNMQWLPTTYKITGKDRWERKIYDNPNIESPACNNEVVR